MRIMMMRRDYGVIHYGQIPKEPPSSRSITFRGFELPRKEADYSCSCSVKK